VERENSRERIIISKLRQSYARESIVQHESSLWVLGPHRLAWARLLQSLGFALGLAGSFIIRALCLALHLCRLTLRLTTDLLGGALGLLADLFSGSLNFAAYVGSRKLLRDFRCINVSVSGRN
jgi:hypothetical protein